MALRVSGAAIVLSLCAFGCNDDDSDVTGDTTGSIDPESGMPFCGDGPIDKPCVDEMGARLCPVDTGYPGDEYALCQPDEDKGMLLHYGPKSYDDPDEVALYQIEPSVEAENCMFAHTPNTEDRLVKNYHGRIRPNSHHLIVTTLDEDVPDTTEPGPCKLTDAVGARWLVGAQDPVIDVTITGLGGKDAPPPKPEDPDYGLAQKVLANTPVRLDLHYINTSDEVVLREGWVSFDYVDEAQTKNLVDMITFFQATIDVPPLGEYTTSLAKCTASTDRYVGLLTGHAHKAMTRTSVWKEDLAGAQELVYETYDWFEPGNLFYRTGVDNPVPNAQTKQHGGTTGYLPVKAGESLLFQCQYKNQTEDTLHLGETTNDEMCNIFGMYYPTDGNVWTCTCIGEQCSALRLNGPPGVQ